MKAKLIKNETKLFSWTDPDFINWNIDEGVKVKKQKLATKIPDKDFTFKDVFTENDVISQSEIIDYVKKHKEEIKKYSHFFLLKNSSNQFFVAVVRVNSDGSYVNVDRLEYAYVWDAKYARRVVVPQLNLKPLESSPSETLTLENRVEELEKVVEKLRKFLVI